MPDIRRLCLSCILLPLWLSAGGYAADAGASEAAALDFSTALQRVLHGNAKLRKAELGVEIAQLAVVRARSAFFPRLDLNSGTQRIKAYGDIPGLESLLLEGRSSVYSASTSLRLGLNLFAGGADVAAVQLAEERVQEELLQLTQQRVALARLLLDRFNSARQAEIDLHAAELQMAASFEKLARARAEFDAGRIAKIVRDDAQFELQQRELESATKHRALAQALGELQALLGDSGEPVRSTASEDDYSARLTQRGLTASSITSDVDISESRVRQATVELKKSRSRFLPKIDVFMQVTFTGINESSAASAFKDQPKDKSIFGLVMAWNLFDGFDSTAEYRANQRRVDSAITDVALSVEEQRRQRKELKRPLADSQSNLELQGQRLALAKARLDISRVKLETGRTDGTNHRLAEIELQLQALEIQRLSEALAYHRARLQLLPKDL